MRTCPDCGGILEASRPKWMSTIALASEEYGERDEAARWQCLICGYEETASDQDDRLPIEQSA